ncbi:MAG: hypothetical protein K2M42_03340 [Oscillospiraceae bacterium]|nr:hypothetical protein [Oscillospiraceae bacterium]
MSKFLDQMLRPEAEDVQKNLPTARYEVKRLSRALGELVALQAKGGDAYNDLRKEGIQAEMDALDGELGDAIGEINRIMGENQARKENLQEQYMREVKAMVTTGEKGELWDKLDVTQQNDLTEMSQRYAELMSRYEESGRTDWEAGAELESLYKQTEALGQAYFDNSDEVSRLNDIELDEIEAIRENTAGLTEATQASYNLAQALSKGLVVRAVGNYSGSTAAKGTDWDVSHIPYASGTYVGGGSSHFTYSGLGPYTHAYGLGRVPYDDYPALLHRDERVLTASEARAQDAGQGTAPAPITITGNNFIGTPEEFADQIWEIIVRKLERAYTAAAPK